MSAKTKKCNRCGELGHFSKSTPYKGKKKAVRKLQEEELLEESAESRLWQGSPGKGNRTVGTGCP